MEHHVPFDEEGLPKLADMTNAEIRHGFKLFFINQPRQAEAFFDEHIDVPIFALGKTAILWLWALLTMEEEDVKRGQEMATRAQGMARDLRKAMRPASSWFGSRAKETLSPEAIFYEVMETECMLLHAILSLLGGSVFDKVSAGLNVRTVWQNYSRLSKLVEFEPGQKDPVHLETRAAIDFGFGVFNLACSILPPKILAVAKILGFPTSRADGINSLLAAYKHNSVLSPIAGLGLLMHHTFLQSTYDLGTEKYQEDVGMIMAVAAERYPDSGWFYMFEGRYARLRRQSVRSLECYHRAKDRQSEWKPLADMCDYEIAFSAMALYDFEQALKHWLILLDTNDWSKVFYSYMAATCLDHLGRRSEALQRFQAIKDMEVIKFGTGRIPVDIFCKRRANDNVYDHDYDLVLSALEILYVWAGFYHMNRAVLDMAFDDVARERSKLDATTSPDKRALVTTLYGALCAQLGMQSQAENSFQEVEDLRPELKNEDWLVFYARYELAMLWFRQDGQPTARVVDMLTKASSKKDHNWDTRLHLRIATANYHFKHWDDLGLGRPEAAMAKSLRSLDERDVKHLHQRGIPHVFGDSNVEEDMATEVEEAAPKAGNGVGDAEPSTADARDQGARLVQAILQSTEPEMSHALV
ncbi:uncharacterized protein MONBRDRAFT_31822 [Monosiga brevicollis MX1]|uniref:Tetratricopeptide repeat protein 39B n=1 Tax=Monosiga brevicollis TaxID=81824 RepID=A9UVL3_MONBE|nr:uncharacterized protein MONBRDRAFT_31822 [Monosiga brevicollis MX1]EDQ90603.1 predicted protein [Monosiga brevicollis MX1]|eukprot:XP_001744654.1 hypothetical protein [Monosiga brevicollis MX1]